MIAMTRTGRETLLKMLGEARPTIRIHVVVGGCGCGQNRLGIMFDDATPQDRVFEVDGVTYCIEPEVMDNAQEIVIDYVDPEFKVLPASGKGLCPKCFGT